MNTLLLTVGAGYSLQNMYSTNPLQTQTGAFITDQLGNSIGAVSETQGYAPIPNGASWDLCLDANGNIALASDPYSMAQDAASAVRTFLGECWYDTTLGIPYLTQILGQSPIPYALIKAQCVAAALTVPGVVSAVMYITGLTNRQLTGQLQITDSSGNTQAVTI